MLRQEILEGADFAAVATRESTDAASAAQGGSLGTFTRNTMDPTFEEAAFSAPVGQVTMPVQTDYGLHLILVERRTADSVTASHILVPMIRTDESEVQLFAAADSLERAAERQGLEAAAQSMRLVVRDVSIQAILPFIEGVGQVGEGADWAVEEAVPGEVSPLFETPDAFYVLELVSATPGGIQPFEEARPTIEQVLRMQKKTALVVESGRGLVERIRGGQPLADVAAARAFAGRRERAVAEVRGRSPNSRLRWNSRPTSRSMVRETARSKPGPGMARAAHG
jgi:hypothetical protein